MSKQLEFVVNGRLDQLTGGYIYDRQMIDGLRARGWHVTLHELAGQFPQVDVLAKQSAQHVWHTWNKTTPLLIDGLALPAFAHLLPQHPNAPILTINHLPLGIEGDAQLQAIERDCLAQTAVIIANSTYSQHKLIELYDLDPHRLTVIPPGTVKPSTPPQRTQPHTPFRWLCVATLTPRKGHLLLINALAELKELDWTLVCVGSLTRDETAVSHIRQAIQTHNLTDRIQLVGEQTGAKLEQSYSQADGFVLASDYEGYGMVLAEAMAYGLPVISSTGGAIPYTVPAQAGRLIPPHNQQALTDSLRELMVNKKAWQQLTHHAQQAGQTLPTWQESITKLETVLRQM